MSPCGAARAVRGDDRVGVGMGVRDGTDAGGMPVGRLGRWRARLVGRWRAWTARHPVLLRRVRRVWVVWSWCSLLLVAVAAVLLPEVRRALMPWLWCYWLLVLWFLLARTRTLSWRVVALLFSAGTLLVPVAGLLQLWLGPLLGVPVVSPAGRVLLAAPVEEPLKLLPLAAVLLLARGRARRLSVVDCLLLGMAPGLGFQAAEDALRRIAETNSFLGDLGLGLGELLGNRPPQYGWGPLSGWSAIGTDVVFSGHHVLTALVAVGIGLALRLRRRLGPVVWLLPAGLFALAVVDHAMFNARGQSSLSIPGGFGSAYGYDLPAWVPALWEAGGRGLLAGPFLLVLLVLGLTVDARRVWRVRQLLPADAAPRWTALPARAAGALAARLPGPRRPAALLGGVLLTAGQTATTVLGDLVQLLLTAARPGRGEPGGGEPGGGEPGARRWRPGALLVAAGALRARRELGQGVGRDAERHLPPPVWSGLPALLLALAAALLAGLLARVWLVPVLEPDPVRLLAVPWPPGAGAPWTPVGPAGAWLHALSGAGMSWVSGGQVGAWLHALSGALAWLVPSPLDLPSLPAVHDLPGASDPAVGFVAGLLDAVANWWGSLSLAEQLLVAGAIAAAPTAMTSNASCAASTGTAS